MSERNDQVIALLTRIADGIDRLLRQQAATAPPEVASEQELRGRFGDPEVRMRVRDWSGPDLKGRRMSECPPEFLDLLAETLEWAARKADEKHETTDSGKPVAPYRRADARRARGWAALMRAGKHAPPKGEATRDDAWGGDSGTGW